MFVLVSAVTGGAALRAGMRVYWGLGTVRREESRTDTSAAETSGVQEERETEPLRRTPPAMLAAIVTLVLGSFVMGLLPGAGPAFGHATAVFTDPTGYIAQALFRPVPHHAAPALHTEWTASAVALDLLSVALALAVALVAIRAPRIAPAVRKWLRPAGAAITGLRRLHSGHVGDYVAWPAVGVAGLAVLTGLPLR